MRRLVVPLALALLALPLPAQEATTTVTTPSGLKIEILKEGTPGTAPQPGDRVKVHYTGWLTNGTKFDSSLDRGRPFEIVLGVGMVIAGWDEGLATMTVGSKCKLTIPWNLAYGEAGSGPIPPKSDLVFEVEMLGVTKGTPPPSFRAADPERQKTTESGLRYEVLAEGGGESPGAADLVEMRYTIWTADGKLALSSLALGHSIAGPAASLRLSRVQEKFLIEAARLMKPGASCRFEVPPALCWGATQIVPAVPPDSVTVWQIDFERIIRFAPPDPAKTVKTASGLEYEVLREGNGASPGPRDMVAVHYTGWLEDGKEFDSSHRRGQPARFLLDRVIRGWTEGLQLMKEGGACRFRIPAALAYGGEAKGDLIPANSTLIFDVELLRVMAQ